MSWLMDGARKKQEAKHTGVDQTPKVHGSDSDGAGHKAKSNGTSNPTKEATKHADTAKTTATEQIDGAQKKVSSSAGGAKNAVGTVKGVASGATGA